MEVVIFAQFVLIALPMIVYAYLAKVFLNRVDFYVTSKEPLSYRILNWFLFAVSLFGFVSAVAVIVGFRGRFF